MRSISHVMHDCGIVSRYSFARMTSTGHGACRTTSLATLPNNARWIP
jgi:hypothetical protein